MAKRQTKKFSGLLSIIEIKINTSMRHYLTPDRMTIIENNNNNKG